MELQFNLWPGGVHKALTLSYDDGQKTDIRFSRILQEHGIKATLHLVSGLFGGPRHISAETARELGRAHELSVHTCTHPWLTKLPIPLAAEEILENKRALEALTGCPVRGMSYPYGAYNDTVVELARGCGMEYARTTGERRDFAVPDDFLRWVPTCHHRAIGTSWQDFLAQEDDGRLQLFCMWGHSHEFERHGNWSILEDFCRVAGGRGDIWYATNIEIKDYACAVRALAVGAGGTMVYNPSGLPVWLTADGTAVRLPPCHILRRTAAGALEIRPKHTF